MIKFCRQNQISIFNKIRSGQLDAIAISKSDIVDKIILAMHQHDIFQCLEDIIPDKRANNISIPFKLILAPSIAAKMKIHTSLTDIPFAITDHNTLNQLGYTLFDDEGNLNSSLMTEGSLRNLIKKYEYQDFFTYYNDAVQKLIMPKMDLSANIHILDCTKIEVEYFNSNYEESEIFRDSDGNKARGYKLSTIRGITGDTGIIEDIRFSGMKTHDLALSEEMLRTSPILKSGDILINDRGFISRDVLNFLKSNRNVDTYIPLKRNMEAYTMAVSTAKHQNIWHTHPNRKRKSQKIAFVSNLGIHWQSDDNNDDVDFNACVVWDTEADKPENEFFVFITTDLTKTAKQIIQTYELRPEIEEDYRQLKDFWKLEDFKSTKINVISFHIICVLFGYLFFQLYTMMPEGEQFSHKSLPVILKNYNSEKLPYLIFYSGYEFAIFSLLEYSDIYASCNDDTRLKIKNLMSFI